jgi:nucleotide-binding universal stress UspA family protein
MLIHHKTIDYGKHCVIPFGSYVQATHENNPKNSMRTRTLDAIYLRPAPNRQGGHEVMDLHTGRVITRTCFIEVPITDLVIQTVEQLAHAQGFKNLKFTTRTGRVFYNSDWIAGVDYQEDEDEDQDEEDVNETYQDHENQNIDEDEELEVEEDITQEEIDEIIHEEQERDNPNPRQDEDNDENEENREENVVSDDNAEEDDENEQEEEQESTGSEPRRSTRERTNVERLEPSMTGKSYLQKKRIKKVRFEDEVKEEIRHK